MRPQSPNNFLPFIVVEKSRSSSFKAGATFFFHSTNSFQISMNPARLYVSKDICGSHDRLSARELRPAVFHNFNEDTVLNRLIKRINGNQLRIIKHTRTSNGYRSVNAWPSSITQTVSPFILY